MPRSLTQNLLLAEAAVKAGEGLRGKAANRPEDIIHILLARHSEMLRGMRDQKYSGTETPQQLLSQESTQRLGNKINRENEFTNIHNDLPIQLRQAAQFERAGGERDRRRRT
jgi:hypothetical protein